MAEDYGKEQIFISDKQEPENVLENNWKTIAPDALLSINYLINP